MGTKPLTTSKIPTDFQVGFKTKEELNDNDCLFFLLLHSIAEYHSLEYSKIKWDNASLRRILQNKYSKGFIRKSLGKLNNEGIISVQYKNVPKAGIWWREIQINRKGLYNKYIQEWTARNSEIVEISRSLETDKTDKLFTDEDLPIDLRIDTDNTEPLTEEDYLVFAIILHLEGGVDGNATSKSNSYLSELSNSHLKDITHYRNTEESIFHSLGKLEREGIIRMTVLKVTQTEMYWREIVAVPGFARHQGFRDWLSKKNEKKSA